MIIARHEQFEVRQDRQDMVNDIPTTVSRLGWCGWDEASTVVPDSSGRRAGVPKSGKVR